MEKILWTRGTQAMIQEKKTVFISGNVQLPLEVGARAFISHAGGTIFTSAVVAIHQIAEGLIVFETHNSTYCIAPRQSPTQAFAYRQSALCA